MNNVCWLIHGRSLNTNVLEEAACLFALDRVCGPLPGQDRKLLLCDAHVRIVDPPLVSQAVHPVLTEIRFI